MSSSAHVGPASPPSDPPTSAPKPAESVLDIEPEQKAPSGEATPDATEQKAPSGEATPDATVIAPNRVGPVPEMFTMVPDKLYDRYYGRAPAWQYVRQMRQDHHGLMMYPHKNFQCIYPVGDGLICGALLALGKSNNSAGFDVQNASRHCSRKHGLTTGAYRKRRISEDARTAAQSARMKKYLRQGKHRASVAEMRARVIQPKSMSEYYRVDAKRLRSMLEASAQLGKEAGKEGLHRLALSENDRLGRRWVRQMMTDAGLTVSIDGALNIHGLLAPKKQSVSNAKVLTGSHHDTVRGGGRLDGALGVIAGIEALARIKELMDEGKVDLCNPCEVINFTDEEGRYGGMFGSMCLSGTISETEIKKMRSADSGESIVEALKRFGGTDAEQALASKYDEKSVKAFVELHIEQGPKLEACGAKIGVVEGICGLWKAEFTFDGQSNHAGTTPMRLRRNAFQGCAEVQVAIPAILDRCGRGSTVCTIGSVKVSPNYPNVVPGSCKFTVECRDVSADVISGVAEAVMQEVASAAQRLGLRHGHRIMSNMPPVKADPTITERILSQAKRVCGKGPPPVSMPSGAAHDAQQIGSKWPMGMIFVPSIGGVSHHHTENTKFEDIVLGANVLLNTLIELATTPDLERREQSPATKAKEAASNAHARVKTHPANLSLQVKKRAMLRDREVLLCIDLQNMGPTTARKGVDFAENDVEGFAASLKSVVKKVSAAQKKARADAASEVVHCRIRSMTRDGRDRSALHKRMHIHVPPGDRQETFVEGIGPTSDELVFNKTGSNAFATTNLHYVLSNIGVQRLVCCGVLTDECVAGTVKTACDLGYDVTVLTDACTAATPERHEAALQGLRRFAKLESTDDYTRR